jgi:tRNA A-37 threonylcarbamoyl transferase component Bud32
MVIQNPSVSEDLVFEELTGEENIFQEISEGVHADYIGSTDYRIVKKRAKSNPDLATVNNILNYSEPAYTAESKVNRVKEIAESQEEIGFMIPEVIHSGDEWYETELVKGDTAEEILENAESKEEIRRISRKVGENLRSLHEANWALRDFSPENVIVEDLCGEEEMYLVDVEFAYNNCTRLDQFFDYVNFIDNISYSDEERWELVAESFGQGYDAPESLQEYLQTGLKAIRT